MNTKTINIQVLALLGDAIFSLYIREELLKLGYNNSKKIQQKSIEYVSAKGQVKILNNLIDNQVLDEEELNVIKRGRNNKKESHPKHTEIICFPLGAVVN